MTYYGKHVSKEEPIKKIKPIQNEEQTKKKHVKNNPVIEGKRIIVLSLALITILSGAEVVALSNKNHEENKLYTTAFENNDLLKDVLTNSYSVFTSDNQRLILSEMTRYLIKTNGSLEDLVNSKDIIYQGIIDNHVKQGYNVIHKEDINDEVFFDVTTNYETMNLIKKDSATYNVPESLLVGFTCENNEYDSYDLFNIGSWDSIDSSQNVYNFDTNEKVDLKGYVTACHSTKENQTRYSSMAYRQCLKEANGIMYSNEENVYDSLDYYIDKSIRKNYSRFDQIQKKEHEAKKNRILTATLKYLKNYKGSIEYKFNISNEYNENSQNKVYNFIFDDLSEYLDNDYEEIINYLNTLIKNDNYLLS